MKKIRKLKTMNSISVYYKAWLMAIWCLYTFRTLRFLPGQVVLLPGDQLTDEIKSLGDERVFYRTHVQSLSVTDYVTALLQLYDVISAYELTHLIIDADVGVGVVVDIDAGVNHISASYSLRKVVELKCKRKYVPL